MTMLSLLLLLFIAYLCAKAIGSIWRDAFGTISDNGTTSRKARQQRPASANSKPKSDYKDAEQPIGRDEGEYVDYEEV